jgi:Cu(I)-responsive transcriptional regulator
MVVLREVQYTVLRCFQGKLSTFSCKLAKYVGNFLLSVRGQQMRFGHLARNQSDCYLSINWKVELMNISAAAMEAGLPVKTVRYYSEIGLVEAPSRTASGYRSYDPASVRKLVFIRRAREFGFSIDDCRELLGLYQDQNRSSADVKALASNRLEQIRAKQRELQSLHDTLSDLVECCNGDERPDCPIIDFLR